jgi:hypothetical protein
VNKRGTTPANNFHPEKRKKKKNKKKGYTFLKAREAASVKVFWRNTTRSVARCGDCDKNPQGLTLKDGKRNGYLCIFIFFMGKIVFEF